MEGGEIARYFYFFGLRVRVRTLTITLFKKIDSTLATLFFSPC